MPIDAGGGRGALGASAHPRKISLQTLLFMSKTCGNTSNKGVHASENVHILPDKGKQFYMSDTINVIFPS